MKNKVYHIKIQSQSRFIFSLIVLLMGSTVTFGKTLFDGDSFFVDLILFLIFFGVLFYLSYLISLAKATVIFTDKALVHQWQIRFFLSREKNYEIPWCLIDNYFFEPDKTFDSFVINLSNKTRYKISQINVLPIKDDFEKLISDFPKLANTYKINSTSGNDTIPIHEGKNIYATKAFRWLFYLLIFLAIFIVITSLLSNDFQTSMGAIGLIIASIIFYAWMIKKYKR